MLDTQCLVAVAVLLLISVRRKAIAKLSSESAPLLSGPSALCGQSSCCTLSFLQGSAVGGEWGPDACLGWGQGVTMQRNGAEENRQQDSQDSWRVPETPEAEETLLIETHQDINECSGPTAAEKVPAGKLSSLTRTRV